VGNGSPSAWTRGRAPWRSGCKVPEAIDKCAFALNKNIRKIQNEYVSTTVSYYSVNMKFQFTIASILVDAKLYLRQWEIC